MTSIYALLDPATSEIRYVGKSINVKQRHISHCYSKAKTHVSHWVQSLKRMGGYPTLVVLESGLADHEWPEAEQFWIAYFKFLGARLTNITNGGHHVVLKPDTKWGRPEEAAHVWMNLPVSGHRFYPTEMTVSSQDLLYYMLIVMDKQNIAIAPVAEVVERTGMSTATVARAKKQLAELDYIRAKTSHVYMVNPSHACKTKGDDRPALFEAYLLLPSKKREEKEDRC